MTTATAPPAAASSAARRVAEARADVTRTHHAFRLHFDNCPLMCADGGLCLTGEELGREADDAGDLMMWLTARVA